MAEPRIVLVVGPSSSGKTSLIRRLVDGSFTGDARPTLGLDLEAGRLWIDPDQVAPGSRLRPLLPAAGLEIAFWEIGGREHRDAPRGQRIDGVLLCYDSNDRSSFHRAATVLCNCRLDQHRLAAQAESVLRQRPTERRVPVLLCGTKADAGHRPAVSSEEVAAFLEAHSMRDATVTSAAEASGLPETLHLLAAGILEASQEHVEASAAAEVLASTAAAAAWALPRRCDGASGALEMTSPRGARAHEPPRGALGVRELGSVAIGADERLVEVVGNGPSAPRTVPRCLEQGLLHRAVHVWLCVPRTGALLLRKWSPSARKHPGSWGPTCHGEVYCYGSGGDGHAAEMSAQAAARLVEEQLGVAADVFGELEHWFSCTSKDGMCHELLDVYVAALDGGLPELRLEQREEVDWVYFAQVFGKEVKDLRVLCHLEAEYRSSMVRRLRQRTVPEDVLYAFGEAAVRAERSLRGASAWAA
mmetsp:Transcript_168271/g.540613  ORF Transcript_168271/g.540613 Transcript_168271/m.540613 type:complete len:473 (-) Transcript_168271:104-1522(-)|eukprot:CAMPEP_0203951594 /NCGR_PEP_ID=MMETSP0359-20131031/85446_1 /ASSEMBLY_ACC=CAM_ASM_000338 /TAXON_ID=268821 /ORGANISM="Scrippsiella Hangoei, Strain SHTV-5" /LENGTH=472 /DNA_ID=CAMNT_0050884257 /DNA_START=44 /DNA_END=1462 /DNA_ORIENTATION=-